MGTIDLSKLVTAEAKAAAQTAATRSAFQAAIQAHVDQTAKDRLYDNGHSLAGYVNSTVAAWAAESAAFVAWRDAVWLYAYSEMEKVMNGLRETPTVEAFIAELPAIEWPA